MSRPQSLVTLLLVTVAGIASGIRPPTNYNPTKLTFPSPGIYVLDPAFKELEKEKQLGGQ